MSRARHPIAYDDQLGTSYEFPKRYQKLIRPGEYFVYYRGKRSAAGIQVPRYFGVGVVGAVTPAPKGRLRCTIKNYKPFDEIVPFKQNGHYRGPGANGPTPREVGLHFRTGVRVIDQDVFDEIVAAGLRRTSTVRAGAKRPGRAFSRGATKNRADEVQELADALAAFEAKSKWPTANIFCDRAGEHCVLIVKRQNGVTDHIAVKATEDQEPDVQLSGSGLAFVKAHAATYSLWVFYAVDLQTRTGMLITRKRPIPNKDVAVLSALHVERSRNTKAGKRVGPIPG